MDDSRTYSRKFINRELHYFDLAYTFSAIRAHLRKYEKDFKKAGCWYEHRLIDDMVRERARMFNEVFVFNPLLAIRCVRTSSLI